MRKVLILVLLLILIGCQYHYNLYVVAGKPELPNAVSPTPNGVNNTKELPNFSELPFGNNGNSKQIQPDTSPEADMPGAPKTKSKPMSIAPGDFTATQTQGGNMINVTINLNMLKPTTVSTDANASLQGVPGF